MKLVTFIITPLFNLHVFHDGLMLRPCQRTHVTSSMSRAGPISDRVVKPVALKIRETVKKTMTTGDKILE